MARKYRKKALPVRFGETATKERKGQQGGVVTEVIDRDLSGKALIKRQRALEECSLDAYLRRGIIGSEEHMVGLRFRHAYLRAVLKVQVDDIGGGSQGDPEMSALVVLKAERLLKEAYKVLSIAQRDIIITVCGYGDWAGGSYKLETLHRGLEKLVDLWRVG
jgi:hypothetical protein